MTDARHLMALAQARRAVTRRRRAEMMRRRRRALSLLVLAGCIALLAVVLTSGSSGSPGASRAGDHLLAAPSYRTGRPADGRSIRAGLLRASLSPLRVVSISRAAGTELGIGDTEIEVRFSEPLARRDAEPVLDPPVAGHWVLQHRVELTFIPDESYASAAVEQVVVPRTIRAASGGRLGAPVFGTIPGLSAGVLRVQELLADLGYLPLRFAPTAPVPRTASAEAAAFGAPPAGTFTWRWSSMPSSLRRLWQPGHYGVMTRGAVMAFESTHHLIVNAALSEALEADLSAARLAGTVDPDPYTYVFVTEQRPETLTLYSDGEPILHSLADTGIENSTPIGTFPIYLRLPSQTLVGTYPNGVAYDIPDVRDLNYFDGSFAVHEFVRAAYGFPQSAGCVELPPAAAAAAYRLLHYGTLVTISR